MLRPLPRDEHTCPHRLCPGDRKFSLNDNEWQFQLLLVLLWLTESIFIHMSTYFLQLVISRPVHWLCPGSTLYSMLVLHRRVECFQRLLLCHLDTFQATSSPAFLEMRRQGPDRNNRSRPPRANGHLASERLSVYIHEKTSDYHFWPLGRPLIGSPTGNTVCNSWDVDTVFSP